MFHLLSELQHVATFADEMFTKFHFNFLLLADFKLLITSCEQSENQAIDVKSPFIYRELNLTWNWKPTKQT